jgi:hypothetical protein
VGKRRSWPRALVARANPPGAAFPGCLALGQPRVPDTHP